MSTDWDRYRKCPACHAAIGDACSDLTGTVVGGRALDARRVDRDRPHSPRKLRAAAARDAEFGRVVDRD